MPDWTLEDLEENFPNVAWCEPISVLNEPGGPEHFACRICIANKGLRGVRVPELPTSEEEVREHIKKEHMT